MKKIRYIVLIVAMLALASLTLVACGGYSSTVRLDANGGVCAVETVSAPNGKVERPPAAEREGYVFTGWYTERDGSTRWNFDSDRADEGGMTLYAGWTAKTDDFVSVTYNVGSGATHDVSKRDVRKDNLLPTPSDPAREGYRFDGWFKDETFSQAWDFAEDKVQNTLTLYAKWTAMHTVTIVDGDERMENVYEHGEALSAGLGVKDGFVFAGLYSDTELENAVESGTLVTDDMTLYASFVKATPKEMFEYTAEWGDVRITGLSEDFDGREIVIPETIEGKKVTGVSINMGEKDEVDKVVISSSVSYVNYGGLKAKEIVFSPANRNYTVYEGCLYHKYSSYDGWSLDTVPDGKTVISVMSGASVGWLDSSKLLILSDDVSVHDGDYVAIGSFNVVVPDEYYGGYADLISDSSRLFKKSEMTDNALVRGNTIYKWIGGAEAVIGVDDGITAVAEGALYGVTNVTFGAGISSIEGRLFGGMYGGDTAYHFVYKFLGDVPERTGESWNFFPSVDENDTREIFVTKEHAVDFIEAWSEIGFGDIKLTTDDKVLVDDEGRLLRWFGGDKAVVGVEGDGITVIGSQSLYGIHDVTFGENIEMIENDSLFGWYMNTEEHHLKYTFLGKRPRTDYMDSLFTRPQNEMSSLEIWLPVELPDEDMREYRNGMYNLWQYVKFDTEEEFVFGDNGTGILKYNGNEKTVRIPEKVSVQRGALALDVEKVYFTRPTSMTNMWSDEHWTNFSHISKLDSIDIYIPNSVFEITDGDNTRTVYQLFEIYVDFENYNYEETKRTVNIHVDTSNERIREHYEDLVANRNQNSTVVTYKIIEEVNTNA